MLMPRKDVSKLEMLVKRELKDLGVFVNILGGQSRMPSSSEIEVVVNMVSRCVEHIRDANTPYNGTIVGGAGVVNTDGSNCNMVLEQCAAQLLSLHNHNAMSSYSNSNSNQHNQPKAPSKEVSFAVASASSQYSESECSDRDREGTDSSDDESDPTADPVPQPRRLSRQARQSTGSAEEGESHRTVDPVPQPRRLSRQPRQSTDSSEDDESDPTADPVPQPSRLSSSRQSRQSTGSSDKGESHPTADPVPQPRRRSRQSRQSTGRIADPVPQPLRRSSREPRQRDLSIDTIDLGTPSSSRKKPRLSANPQPVSSEATPASNFNSPVGKVRWTPAMDARLTEAVAQYRDQGWARVAEFMGDGLSSGRCCSRWGNFLEPLQRGLKSGNWQSNEEKRLLELVPQHLIPSQWSSQQKAMTQERTDWKAIGEKLGRVSKDCWNKYKSIQEGQMNRDPFTAKEDALILQREEEWGDKGNGLWAALEREMGRSGKLIKQRWHDLVYQSCNT